MSNRLPTETFRIRPWKQSRRFFVVHVAENQEAMHRAMEESGILAREPYLGMCVSTSSDSKGWRGLLGVVFVSRQSVGGGLVAHELAHAAFRTIERKGGRVAHWERGRDLGAGMTTTNESEEQFCRILEHLVKDFWTRWYEMEEQSGTTDERG